MCLQKLEKNNYVAFLKVIDENSRIGSRIRDPLVRGPDPY
jgi:hypothetical protein